MSTKKDQPKTSLRERAHTGLAWLRQAVTEPQRNLDEFQRRVRDAFEIGRFSLRHLAQDRAPQMAAALAFRTLFGILPVLVVATIAARPRPYPSSPVSAPLVPDRGRRIADR